MGDGGKILIILLMGMQAPPPPPPSTHTHTETHTHAHTFLQYDLYIYISHLYKKIDVNSLQRYFLSESLHASLKILSQRMFISCKGLIPFHKSSKLTTCADVMWC